MTNVIATERLWLTADRDRVVGESDPAAVFLFAAEGDEIAADDAERYGLKQRAQSANKAAPKAANKAAGEGP